MFETKKKNPLDSTENYANGNFENVPRFPVVSGSIGAVIRCQLMQIIKRQYSFSECHSMDLSVWAAIQFDEWAHEKSNHATRRLRLRLHQRSRIDKRWIETHSSFFPQKDRTTTCARPMLLWTSYHKYLAHKATNRMSCIFGSRDVHLSMLIHKKKTKPAKKRPYTHLSAENMPFIV